MSIAANAHLTFFKLRRSAMSIAETAHLTFFKRRRSAMSIAGTAPWSLLKLRRSGMFLRWFMDSLVSLCACIRTMNPLKLAIPKGLRPPAQGCRACEATLGWTWCIFTTLKGLRQMCATRSAQLTERRTFFESATPPPPNVGGCTQII